MHHTDYSHNLRQAKHSAAKNLATNATSGNSTQKNRTNPLLAFISVILILIAIFQMDPANAEATMDVAGYGTLKFTEDDQSVRATAMKSDLIYAFWR